MHTRMRPHPTLQGQKTRREGAPYAPEKPLATREQRSGGLALAQWVSFCLLETLRAAAVFA